MKNQLACMLVVLVCAFNFSAFAQVGIGTDAPSSKAVLELKSPNNNQGFLVPRLTTAQRTAITLTTDDKGMLVFDSSVNKFYYWSGTVWVVIEDSVGSGTVTNVITGAGLTGGPISVTGTISLADGGVATVKLADNAVTSAKIVDGTIATTDLANNAVTSVKIIDGGVATADLADASVTTLKLNDGSVTDAKISSVAPGKLTAGTATAGQVLKWSGTAWTPQADNAGAGTLTSIIAGAGLTGGTITSTGTITLADAGVTTVKLADNAVTSAKIIDGTIATADLADASVATVKVVDGAITSAKILDGTVAATDLANNAITTLKINDGAVTSAKIADGTIATADMADGSVTSAKIADGTIATVDLTDGSVTDAKISAVAPGKITAGAATTGQVLKWSGTAWTPQADNAGIGTVTSITAGTGLTGGAITTAGTISIVANGVTATELRSDASTDANRAVTTNHIRDNAITSVKIVDGTIATADLADASVTAAKLVNTTVTPGAYGSSTVVPRITVDPQGRITGVTNQTISAGVNQNLQSVLATGNNAGNSEAVNFNAIGIGTDKPMGNLHVIGSQLVNQTVISDSYELKPTDYSIFVTNSAKPMAIKLPPIEGDPIYIGRVIVIRTINTATVTILADTPSKDFIDFFGTQYDMAQFGNADQNNRFHTFTFIATKLPGGNRWVIVSGLKGQL